MYSLGHDAHLSDISPPSGAASTTSDLTLFNPLTHASPYATSENSPFAPPRPDPPYLDINQNDWGLNNPPFRYYDTSPYRHMGSQNFTETTLSQNAQPPPHQFHNYLANFRIDPHINQNGHQSSQPRQLNPAQQIIRVLRPTHPQTIMTEPTRAHPSQERSAVPGSRSAVDRQRKAAHTKSVAEVMSTSTKFYLSSSLLRKALYELYPHCKTFGDCMESLIHDYYVSTGRVSNINAKGSPDQRDQIECVASQRGSSQTMVSSDLSDTNSESGCDDEMEGTIDDDISESEIDLDLDSTDISDTTNRSKMNTGRPSSSLRTVLPSSNQQSSNATVTEQLYACPFHKRNPTSYENRRACSGSGWDKVRRVK
jgi:hypothetical protein